MIDKEDAKKAGVRVVDADTAQARDRSAVIEQLKQLLPGLINGDGQLDINALNNAIGAHRTTGSGLEYGLKFAGKGLAEMEAGTLTTDYELSVNPDQSKSFDDSDNVVIRGDNLEVLRILEQNYSQKIKMIYIDPPYNTTKENFIFKDNFRQSEEELCKQLRIGKDAIDSLHDLYGMRSHSGWLSFMYPRLKLARGLLSKDGFIFISIDDNEVHNLRCICNEIFGENNFLGCLPTIMNLKGNQDEFGFAGTHEYTLVFAKDKKDTVLNQFQIGDEDIEEWEEDEIGLYKQGANLKATGGNAPREKRPNLFFPIFVDSSDNIYVTDDDSPPSDHEGDLTKLLPVTKGREMSWRWGKKKILNQNKSLIVSRNGGMGIYKKQRPGLGDLPSKKPKTTFYKPEYSSGNGTAQIQNLFGSRVFDNPKPNNLLEDFIRIGLNSDGIVLDFFAGSGTTGEAVMRLNAEDGGCRKFVLVQWDGKIAPKAEAYEFCRKNGLNPVISSITIERLNRAGEAIKEEFARQKLFGAENPLDIGYKVFELCKKPQIAPGTGNQKGTLEVTDRRNSVQDTLFNMLCATCKPLHTPVQCLEEGKLYRADDELYLLASVETDLLRKYNDCKINIDGWSDVDLRQYVKSRFVDMDYVTIIY